MHDFVRNLITEWRRADSSGAGPVVIALSGGADSTALACALSELRANGKIDSELVAAHFDHGLRGKESDEDEAFSRALAGSLNLEYRSGKANRDEIQGNVEQSARRARYRYLLSTALSEGATQVVTGHTINDQAETFLMNLLRGSGPDGLAAMAVKRNMKGSDVTLFRPMVRWATREMTVQYCREVGVEYRNDLMNDDTAFTRVRIRKELIPALGEFNPLVIETLSRTAGSIRELNTLLEHLAHRDKEINELMNSRYLEVGKLKRMTFELMKLTIRGWVRNRMGHLKGLSSVHLTNIADLVHSKKSGKTVELPGGRTVVKGLGKLELKDRVVD